ncbi:hypothetical protein [Labrys neptuniae]
MKHLKITLTAIIAVPDSAEFELLTKYRRGNPVEVCELLATEPLDPSMGEVMGVEVQPEWVDME